jgi:hypothetical protein
MIQLQKCFDLARAARSAVIAITLGVACLTTWTLSADARGGHGLARGFGSGHGMHGPQFAGDRHHRNDAYTKAVSDERDKLLSSKLKSICRGC